MSDKTDPRLTLRAKMTAAEKHADALQNGYAVGEITESGVASPLVQHCRDLTPRQCGCAAGVCKAVQPAQK